MCCLSAWHAGMFVKKNQDRRILPRTYRPYWRTLFPHGRLVVGRHTRIHHRPIFDVHCSSLRFSFLDGVWLLRLVANDVSGVLYQLTRTGFSLTAVWVSNVVSRPPS